MLKQENITYGWNDILRIASTQDFVTTNGKNAAGFLVETKKCRDPIEDLKLIREKLGILSMPYNIDSKDNDVPNRINSVLIKTCSSSG